MGYPEACEAEFYEWAAGTLGGAVDPIVGYTTVFTAPAAGEDCITPQSVILYCDENQVDFIEIVINPPGCSAEIGYTTQQMAVNGTQTLTASGATPGCGDIVYDWAITAGGGTLSASQGTSVIYTAPATNAQCANNPTITLSVNGTVCDTLKIAVNAAAQSFAYYLCWKFSEIPPGNQCTVMYTCTGVLATTGMGCTRTNPNSQCIPYEALCTLATCCRYEAGDCTLGSPVDVRTVAQKNNGCCPAALIV
ncbi:MAG: hypothetical protein KKF33_20490 [Alphaproteobacteria bacterium]|nr:hypothetical protein [Alphaproteobacteria bacterium]